jgi:predicted NBD/HSP70 family sugar kinase
VKKIITVAKNRNEIFKQPQLTIGVDLGDRISHYCILDDTGNVILEQNVPTTPKGIQQVFSRSRAVESHWKPGHIRPG